MLSGLRELSFPLVFFCLSFRLLFGQADRSVSILDMGAEELRVEPVNALVWELDRPDIKEPSYLFGILYKVAQEDFFLPEGLQGYLNQCDKLFMEVDPIHHNLDHLFKGTLPIDSTLDVLLPKKQYQWIHTYIKDSLSDLAYYQLKNRYAPTILARQVMSDYCLDFRPGKEAVSYETKLAQITKLPIKALGTEWMRTTALESEDFLTQSQYLVKTIEERLPLCATYQAMVRAYRRQNLDQIWLLAKDAPDLGDNSGGFIEARNHKWLDLLTRQMKYESFFIAVNAIQLPGEYGLIHLLKKEGFTVKALDLPIPEK